MGSFAVSITTWITRVAATSLECGAIVLLPMASMLFVRNFSSEVSPMSKRAGTGFALIALAMVLVAALPSLLHAQETTIEKAGVAVGVSAGNVIFLPAKALSTSM